MKSQKIAALTRPTTTSPSRSARRAAGTRARRVAQAARGSETPPILALEDVRVDLTRREASGAQGAIRLTPLEYRVLECLAHQSGLIVTTRRLLRGAWGPERVGESGALRVCIKSLRDKLEPDPRRPRFIVTEAGVGYRLKPADSGDA